MESSLILAWFLIFSRSPPILSSSASFIAKFFVSLSSRPSNGYKVRRAWDFPFESRPHTSRALISVAGAVKTKNGGNQNEESNKWEAHYWFQWYKITKKVCVKKRKLQKTVILYIFHCLLCMFTSIIMTNICLAVCFCFYFFIMHNICIMSIAPFLFSLFIWSSPRLIFLIQCLNITQLTMSWK